MPQEEKWPRRTTRKSRTDREPRNLSQLESQEANSSDMVLSSVPEQGPSLILIEGGLTAVAFAVAFCLPRLGSARFSHVERAFGALAQRKSLSVAVVGLAALLLRLAILPICPI